MPKGRSYAADPWDSYDKGSHSFAQDDFVHDKTFVFKAKLEKSNDGINIKETINEKAEGLSGTGQVKFWCNISDNRSFYAKVGSASNMQLQYDNGIRDLKDLSTNWFAGLETNRTFTERVFNLGLEVFQKKDWSFGSRWRYDLGKKVSQIDNKGSWVWNNWRVNGFHTVDISNKLLVKSGILIARHHTEEEKCKCDYFVRFEGARQADKLSLSQIIDQVTLSCTEQVSQNQRVGIEARLQNKNINGFLRQPWKGFDSFWLTSEWKWGGTTLKARVNTELTHAVTIKNKWGEWGSYSLGVAGSELGTKNRFRFGIQMELNL